MTILTTKNPPSNYILSEDWLNTVLTTSDTGDAGTPSSLIDSNKSGKISDGWLYLSSVKLTTLNTPYKNPETNVSGYVPSKYLVQLDKSTGHIDYTLLNLLNDADTKIVNLPSGSNYIPLTLLNTTSSNITANTKLVTTDNEGNISYDLISNADTRVANTEVLVKTKASGYIDKSFFNIQRIMRVLKADVSASTNYTINSTSQNSNPDTNETLTVPTNHKDLYVFVNGSLLAEGDGLDYTIPSGSNFRFKNGLSNGDILQFIVLN